MPVTLKEPSTFKCLEFRQFLQASKIWPFFLNCFLFIEHLPLSDSGLHTTQGRMPFSLCNCSFPLSAWIGDDWMLTACVARLSLHIHGCYGLLKEHSHLTLIANCYLLNWWDIIPDRNIWPCLHKIKARVSTSNEDYYLLLFVIFIDVLFSFFTF